ncbi:hypothetical protein OS493_035740 [Desmophyllum pertusum]|uniref:Uncharacterized protein n=1 Tax=Desmophyllum pertusum TaxID=174260 RepID=A0A9W9ZX56_9CNID|nr:hypothetical protein OS493_035740 [Desmophyllum pertusum]
MARHQQLASRAAEGTGRLRGVLELTKALQEINAIESRLRTRCFTKFHHSTDMHKWSFDSVKDGAFFDELHKGQTRFTIKVAKTSGKSYNIRLLKMYVELYGDGNATQGGGYPAKVYLNLRRMAASYFRDESDTIKKYRQPLGLTRKFKFNRFAITDDNKCNEEKKKGNGAFLFCMDKGDRRFQPMCCHYLSDLPCDANIQLGALECQRTFGTYELSIPIDKTLACDDYKVTHQNCKDFDRTKFTKMNVWAAYLYWSGAYPTGPDDARCNKLHSPSSRSKVQWPKPQLILKHKPNH